MVVALAKIGNRDAFGELVRRRQSWVRNLLRRLSGDPALADDLAQQAFFSAWKNLGALNANRAFGTWLKRLAVNAWLDHRRRKDLLAAGADDEAIEPPAPARGVSPAQEIDLDRALDSLAGPVRLCIVLSYCEGMSHGAIAELTGIPLGTVKSHIGRGLEQLRRLLGAPERSTARGEAHR